jgi:hypothetical protein
MLDQLASLCSKWHKCREQIKKFETQLETAAVSQSHRYIIKQQLKANNELFAVTEKEIRKLHRKQQPATAMSVSELPMLPK